MLSGPGDFDLDVFKALLISCSWKGWLYHGDWSAANITGFCSEESRCAVKMGSIEVPLLFRAKDVPKASATSFGSAVVLPFIFKVMFLEGTGPRSDLILFHISVDEVLDVMLDRYVCQLVF